MAQPPTPDRSGLGLGTPPQGRGFRGIPVRVTNQPPMITVDPQAAQKLGQVKQAVISLRGEVKRLADEAERYARAIGGRPGAGGGPGRGGGSRPANFPEPMGRRGGGGGGGSRPGGGLDESEERRLTGIRNAVLLPQIMQMLGSQLGGLIQRERTTTRLAMAQTGTYGGQTQATPWQSMLRGATGYSGTGDLYAGANTLGELGLLRSPNDPRTRQAVRQAGQLAIMGGTNFQGGAGAMGTFMSPQTVNAMRQRGIQATPGGQLNMFGQSGMLEQLFSSMQGQSRGEDFWRTGLRQGSPLRANLEAMGLGQQEMGIVQQYGLSRSEVDPKTGQRRTAEAVEKDIAKRYKDTGETMRQLQEAASDLKDVLAGGLIPIIKTVTSVLKPIATTLTVLTEKIPQMNNALGLLIGALIAWQVKVRIASMLGAGGGGAGLLGGLGQTAAGGAALGRMGGAAGLAANAAKGAGWATLGLVAGDITQNMVGGEHGTTRSKVGGVLGGAARGAGAGALVGSVVPVIGTGVGAAVGGALGGVWGALKGDPVGPWDTSPVGDGGFPTDADLLAHPPPATSTPGGGPLPGAGNSANLNPTFVERLQAMFAANPKLKLTSGWRSHEEQAFLRWKKLTGRKKVPVAPVGQSKHESGFAADIGPASEYGWLAQNAPKYGLKLPMPGVEPWHWELPKGAGGDWSAPAMDTMAATGAPQASGTASSHGGSATASPMGPARRISGGMNEADVVAAFFAGGGYGATGAGGGSSDASGDPVAFTMPAMGSGGQSIIVHKIEINLSIAKATYEEAERTARYIGQILGDRERLLVLAQGGTTP